MTRLCSHSAQLPAYGNWLSSSVAWFRDLVFKFQTYHKTRNNNLIMFCPCCIQHFLWFTRSCDWVRKGYILREWIIQQMGHNFHTILLRNKASHPHIVRYKDSFLTGNHLQVRYNSKMIITFTMGHKSFSLKIYYCHWLVKHPKKIITTWTSKTKNKWIQKKITYYNQSKKVINK